MMWWQKYRGIDSKQEVWTFFISIHHFLTVFAYFPTFGFLAHFAHFAHLMGEPPSPMTPISTFISPVLNEPMGDIPARYH